MSTRRVAAAARPATAVKLHVASATRVATTARPATAVQQQVASNTRVAASASTHIISKRVTTTARPATAIKKQVTSSAKAVSVTLSQDAARPVSAIKKQVTSSAKAVTTTLSQDAAWPGSPIDQQVASPATSQDEARPGSPIDQQVASPAATSQDEARPVSAIDQQEVASPATPSQDELNEELLVLRAMLSQQDEAHQQELSNLAASRKVMEDQMSGLALIVKKAEEREQAMIRRTNEAPLSWQSLQYMVLEYENTIETLLADKEDRTRRYEEERVTLVNDKEIVMGHLTNIEVAFTDVHQKYERLKGCVEGYKANELSLRQLVTAYENKCSQQEEKYNVLKAHAMQQLENANQELEAIRKKNQAEVAMYEAKLKKYELRATSLDEQLNQKRKENLELTSICDDLIGKFGG